MGRFAGMDAVLAEGGCARKRTWSTPPAPSGREAARSSQHTDGASGDAQDRWRRTARGSRVARPVGIGEGDLFLPL